MNAILWIITGYLVHDAVQPTAVGNVLDKIALPPDLFVKKDDNTNA